jgi:hypothetical protein
MNQAYRSYSISACRSACSGSTTLQPHSQFPHWKPRNRATRSGKSTSQPPHGSPRIRNASQPSCSMSATPSSAGTSSASAKYFCILIPEPEEKSSEPLPEVAVKSPVDGSLLTRNPRRPTPLAKCNRLDGCDDNSPRHLDGEKCHLQQESDIGKCHPAFWELTTPIPARLLKQVQVHDLCFFHHLRPNPLAFPLWPEKAKEAEVLVKTLVGQPNPECLAARCELSHQTLTTVTATQTISAHGEFAQAPRACKNQSSLHCILRTPAQKSSVIPQTFFVEV